MWRLRSLKHGPCRTRRLRWIRNLGLFMAYVVGSMALARIVRSIIKRSIATRGDVETPAQLHRRHVRPRHRVCGVLAGFRAGNQPGSAARGHRRGWLRGSFALQGTLSNFASGLLIMVNKPFDIGDRVTVGGDIEGRWRTCLSSRPRSSLSKHAEDCSNNTILAGVIVNHTTGEVAPP